MMGRPPPQVVALCGAAMWALECAELKRPDIPDSPEQPDASIKDAAKLAAEKEAFRLAYAEYKETLREYREVLVPAFMKEYYRAHGVEHHNLYMPPLDTARWPLDRTALSKPPPPTT